jgi:hypothetical protein
MRKIPVALAVLATVTVAVTGEAGGDRGSRRVSVPAGLSVVVSPGWHVLRGWLSDVTDPAPRLAAASFPARLSRRTCECGFPNVVNLPRTGAFVFVWEYLHPTRRGLARTPSRPHRFHLTTDGKGRNTCYGPTDEFSFKDAGRVFQVEVYLGPGASAARRGQAATMLDSWLAEPNA